MSGGRRTIRIRDVNGEPARTFAGFTWFPIDPTFRVTGRFIKDAAPRQVRRRPGFSPARRRIAILRRKRVSK
jgi:uncharacterized protein (DUF1684 family)